MMDDRWIARSLWIALVSCWLGACADGGAGDRELDAGQRDNAATSEPLDAGFVGDGRVIFDAGAQLTATCGDALCDQFVNLIVVQLDPCCAPSGIDAQGDAVQDVCGVGVEGLDCVQVNQPGVEDGQCPDEVILGMITARGCCRPDGRCGLITDATLGCVARDDPSSEAFMASFPAQDCTP